MQKYNFPSNEAIVSHLITKLSSPQWLPLIILKKGSLGPGSVVWTESRGVGPSTPPVQTLARAGKVSRSHFLRLHFPAPLSCPLRPAVSASPTAESSAPALYPRSLAVGQSPSVRPSVSPRLRCRAHPDAAGPPPPLRAALPTALFIAGAAHHVPAPPRGLGAVAPPRAAPRRPALRKR